jgi:hypothetical protein
MRTPPWAALPIALAAIPLAGCPVGHQAPGARAQETANEFNVDTRFGRMELAAEKVAPDERDAFLERRRAWGASVRVADYELAGVRMKGDADAEMFVRVSWYRVDQGDLHLTTLKQKWHDFKGEWKLVDEGRADGDPGLIGDGPAPAPAAIGAVKAKPAQFPTIRLGAPPEPITAPATIAPPDLAAGDAN